MAVTKKAGFKISEENEIEVETETVQEELSLYEKQERFLNNQNK